MLNKVVAAQTLFFHCDIQTLFNNPKFIFNVQQIVQCASFMNEVYQCFTQPYKACRRVLNPYHRF